MVNIDHLFNDYIQIGQINSISMVYDVNINKDKNNNILLLTINNAYNSGLIILKPDIKIAHILFNELLSYGVPWLNNNKTDQDVLNKIINSRLLNINVLQPKYNISPSLVNDMLNNKFFDKAYVIHYMLSPKPWDVLDGVMDINNGYSNNVCQQLYKLWMNTYCDMTTEKYFCKKLTDSNLCHYYYNGIKDEANKRILLELPKNDSGYITPNKPYIPDMNNIPQ
jgi:lipopolysaccharide biosynthesis glycosyltransferase